ncbi:unnamed protein product [Linum tenue]|uniref:TCP domain-containing protein n=1 Tax=Linum tenue TaxID=586396 RepID=A0AAV0QUD8_9ROSI|nr:unnamed protein product [Linum tenue]
MFSSTSDPFSYSPYNNNNNNNNSTPPPPPHNIIAAAGGGTDPFEQQQLQLSCCSSPTQNLPSPSSLRMMFDHDHHQLTINPGHGTAFRDTTTNSSNSCSSFLCHPYPPNHNNANFPFLLPTDHPYYLNNHHLQDGIPAENYNNIALTMQQQQQHKRRSSSHTSSNKNKERHSKIETAGGVRDRRVRLSIATSRKFFDLQDMLGFDKPSKTLDWLLSNSAAAIQRLHITSHPHPLYNNTNTPPPRPPAATEEVEETSVSRRAKARARARDRTSTTSSRSKQPAPTEATLPLPSPLQYYHYHNNNNNNNTSTSTCNNFGVLRQQQPYLSGIAIGVGSSYSTEMIQTAAPTTTRSTTTTATNDDGHSSLRLMKWELLKPTPQSTIKHQTPHNAHHKTTTATWDMMTDAAPTAGMQMSLEGDLNSSVAHFINPPSRFH